MFYVPVHICHCMTKAPRIAGGVHSAAKIGTVADFGPIPNPRANLATNIPHQEFTNPCQKHAIAENKQVMKIVPRRPNQLL
jgi:hypothetical protein